MPSIHRKLTCAFCGKKVPKTRDWQKFCSAKCRIEGKRAGYLPAAALERLVKKFIQRWTDAIIDREIAKKKAKLEEDFRKEIEQIQKSIQELRCEKEDKPGYWD